MLDLSKNIINTDYLHDNLYSYTNVSQIEKEVTSAASFSYSLLKKILLCHLKRQNGNVLPNCRFLMLLMFFQSNYLNLETRML